MDSLTGRPSEAVPSSQSSAQASSMETDEKQIATTHPSEDVLAISDKSGAATNEGDGDDGGHDIDNAEYPKGIHLFTIVLGLVMAMMLAVMDMTILATAIPHITDQFHSLDDVGWYASVYFVTVASSQSAWGKAYKYFDLKTVFLLTIFLFELGSLICGKLAMQTPYSEPKLIPILGVANSSITLIIGRAVTGYGAAGVLAGCYTIVAFAVRPEKRPAFAGVLAATYGVASSIAPVLGGALADKVSWRWWCVFDSPSS
jgi:MFS family permease